MWIVSKEDRKGHREQIEMASRNVQAAKKEQKEAQMQSKTK